MLGGWGMLIRVQGEGARVGETPPSCLTTPPPPGDPDLAETAKTCQGADGGGGTAAGGESPPRALLFSSSAGMQRHP